MDVCPILSTNRTFTHTYIALHGGVERADLLIRDMNTGEYVLKTTVGG